MKLKKLTIKKMDIKDLDEVLFIDISSSLTPWSKKMFMEEMLNPFAYCFIIQFKENSEHHQVIGYICFRMIEDESELLNICVHPHYRQLGIGKKMMQFYIEFCCKKEIKTFYLDVNFTNQPAIQLYQLFSYQSVGVRQKFYQGKFDALLMMKRG
jgi:ribosomal-protein-alanine N-acetyltransferase